MVRGILFKDERFDTTDDNNMLNQITKNIIILCNNRRLMHTFAEEIINTINGSAEYNDYDCDDGDIGKAKSELSFGLQHVIDINGQKVFLCLEPAMVYKAKRIEDIWFLDWIVRDGNYREQIYPMTVFKGSREVWNGGLDKVYRMIVSGRYGCYDGKWAQQK